MPAPVNQLSSNGQQGRDRGHRPTNSHVILREDEIAPLLIAIVQQEHNHAHSSDEQLNSYVDDLIPPVIDLFDEIAFFARLHSVSMKGPHTSSAFSEFLKRFFIRALKSDMCPARRWQ